jgi:hypothetical protein
MLRSARRQPPRAGHNPSGSRRRIALARNLTFTPAQHGLTFGADQQGDADMRLTLLLTLLAGLASLTFTASSVVSPAAAETCTGANCPPKEGQSGGHDCEKKKKEQTVS